MEDSGKIFGKYVCLDIVSYTQRSEKAQLEILKSLNRIVADTLAANHISLDDDKSVICLPTGDGMCIALINKSDPEIHLRVALDILSGVAEHNQSAKGKDMVFQVRVGINSHTDNLVKDIYGRKNIAGVGINTAFRIMDRADGRQILIGPAVHQDQRGRQFEKMLKRREVLVKHGEEITVYQLLTKELDRRVPHKIQVEENLIKPAQALGVRKIYPTLEDFKDQQLLKEIDSAKERIWLLDISLQDEKLVKKLKEKLDRGLDVRILLLDALRSPAVFFALMRSSEEQFRKIVIETDRTKLRKYPANDPYWDTMTYSKYVTAHAALKRDGFKSAVKFYGLMPNCRLVIVDKRAFYQPYTLSSAQDEPPMPVIEVGSGLPPRQQAQGLTTQRLLMDHFELLWQTSAVDLFQTGGRIAAKEIILWKLFEERLPWLKHVHGVLHNERSPGRDQRASQRQRCISPSLVAETEWPDAVSIKSKILDHSRASLLLALRASAEASALFDSLPAHASELEKPIVVKLSINSPKDADDRLNKVDPKRNARLYLVNELLSPAGKKFRFARKEQRIVRGKETLCVALCECGE